MQSPWSLKSDSPCTCLLPESAAREAEWHLTTAFRWLNSVFDASALLDQLASPLEHLPLILVSVGFNPPHDAVTFENRTFALRARGVVLRFSLRPKDPYVASSGLDSTACGCFDGGMGSYNTPSIRPRIFRRWCAILVQVLGGSAQICCAELDRRAYTKSERNSGVNTSATDIGA